MYRPALVTAVAVALSAVVLPAAALSAVAATGTMQAQQAESFDALVFSKTTNFYHESIPYGVAAIEALGEEHGFNVVVSDDAANFTDETLAEFEVVIFNNTNSTPQAGNLLNEEQRAAFQRYIQGGGGFVGIHSASGTERDWEWYGELVGAFFLSHPPIQEVEVEVDDPVHPSTSHLPQEWVRTEEPYDFVTNPRGDVHVLASFDSKSYTGHRMGADHPITWCQNFDGGRSWYTGMGHNPSAFTDEPLFVQHLLGGIQWAAGVVDGDCGATSNHNFEKVLLDGNTDDPLAMDIDETGRVFYVQRGGAVKVFDPTTAQTETVATFDVLVEHTHGMHGIVLDPDFAENHWLYLYYSPIDDEDTVIARFTYDEATGTIDMASRQVLFELPSQREVNAHEGGGMDFDAQGNLYVATGDNSSPCCSGYGATDERPGFEYNDAQRSSANTNDLRGKILRVHPEDDGTYTIPAGNLFPPGTANTRPEIYVMGLRNPYRIHVDEETGWLYWGDVGPDARVDSDTRGSKGFDEWNQARAAGNFGWPHCIGANQAYNDFDYATSESGPLYDCAGGPVNDSPNNTGLTQLPPAQPAWLPYPYDVSPEYPELGSGGRLAIGGPTYHFDPDNPSEAKFPEYYDDTVLIAEWTRNAIFEVKLDEAGQPAIINPFMPGVEFLRPIDLQFGPDGSLYVIEWGTNYGGSGRGDPNTDSGIYKINYARPGERSPVARATATPTSGQPPLTVEFSSEGSGDPDEHPIEYAWDFESDGTVDSTEANPTHTYTERGNVTARLTVTDPTGRTGIVNLPISVGNTAPEVEMIEPVDGQFFDFGEPVGFEVEVADAEDGTSGDGIDCQQVITQPYLGHDQHGHPLEQYHGCTGEIQTIVDDGHGEHDNIYYIVDSTYTDQGADGVEPLTGGDSAILQPRLKQAEHWTSASDVVLFDTEEGTGNRMVGQIGHGDYLSFEPINLRGVDQVDVRYASAGTGGTIELRVDAVDGPLVGSGRLEPTGDSYAFENVTIPVEDPGGSHELFLVFTNNPGDTYLFNLDSLRFGHTVLDGVRAAHAQVRALRAAVAEHGAALTDEQSAYLNSTADRMDVELAGALETASDDPGFDRHLDRALMFANQGRQWVRGQQLDGAMADDVAAGLLVPLDAAATALQTALSRADGVSAALVPGDGAVTAGETVRVEASLTNDGDTELRAPAVELTVPDGWQAEPAGPTSAASLAPGATLTGAWDVSVPVGATLGEVSLTGAAGYAHIGRDRVVVSLSAPLTVRPAVEATQVAVAAPVFSGRETTATVTVANHRSAAAADVTATVSVPDGWTAGSATATVAAGETVTLDVPVTAPAAGPAAGQLTEAQLTATVTAPGVVVGGAPAAATYAVPHGDDLVLALDGGSPTSPVLESYAPLSPDHAWDEARGYGWVTGAPLQRDRGHPDALRRDFVLDNRGPGVLRLTLPPGQHAVSLLTGDPNFSTSGFVVEADGQVVVPARATLPTGTYAWEQFTLDGGTEGRTVDLRLSSPTGNYWRILALLVDDTA
ncbi:ThuA domain-containing protein [Jiangella asiatica]|uniref:Carbohydrate-binding protein n=1 Tax=Jiangella asiatica TaxID=2530372 RepID=A0A4R5DIS5_9ACTN|nr:ThuA domain-containing protein [Jiangella asiatica]TDE14022.1 carbohydrate-binding protein [Jiangella asiatica]